MNVAIIEDKVTGDIRGYPEGEVPQDIAEELKNSNRYHMHIVTAACVLGFILDYAS